MDNYPYLFKNQTVLTTEKDTQGEQVTKEFLEHLVYDIPPKIPLGQQHDMSKNIIGLMENFRILPMENKPGEWKLTADINITDKELLEECIKGGFSYSLTEKYRSNAEETMGCIYFPFPYYNDETLFDEILSMDIPISVGKWRKKSADPVAIALISSFFLFLIGPFWTKVFNESIYPFITASIKKLKTLNKKEVIYEYAQIIKDNTGRIVKIYFIPDRERNFETLSPRFIECGLKKVIDLILIDTVIQDKGAYLIKLYFDNNSNEYKIFFVQYCDGTYLQY